MVIHLVNKCLISPLPLNENSFSGLDDPHIATSIGYFLVFILLILSLAFHLAKHPLHLSYVFFIWLPGTKLSWFFHSYQSFFLKFPLPAFFLQPFNVGLPQCLVFSFHIFILVSLSSHIALNINYKSTKTKIVLLPQTSLPNYRLYMSSCRSTSFVCAMHIS